MSEEGEWVCYDCLSLAESYEHVMNPAGSKVSKTTWEQELDADGNVKHTAGCSMCGIPKRAFLVKGVVVREKGESIVLPDPSPLEIELAQPYADNTMVEVATITEGTEVWLMADAVGESIPEEILEQPHKAFERIDSVTVEAETVPEEKESEIARLEAELAKLKSGEA